MEIQRKWLWRTNSETLNMHPAKDYFSVSLSYKNYFAGESSNSSDSWDFIAYNMDGATRNLKQNTGIGLFEAATPKLTLQVFVSYKDHRNS